MKFLRSICGCVRIMNLCLRLILWIFVVCVFGWRDVEVSRAARKSVVIGFKFVNLCYVFIVLCDIK